MKIKVDKEEYERLFEKVDYLEERLDHDRESMFRPNIHEPPKDFRPEHLKRMGVSICKGGEE